MGICILYLSLICATHPISYGSLQECTQTVCISEIRNVHFAFTFAYNAKDAHYDKKKKDEVLVVECFCHGSDTKIEHIEA